jgi:hypothetical protein
MLCEDAMLATDFAFEQCSCEEIEQTHCLQRFCATRG